MHIELEGAEDAVELETMIGRLKAQNHRNGFALNFDPHVKVYYCAETREILFHNWDGLKSYEAADGKAHNIAQIL